MDPGTSKGWVVAARYFARFIDLRLLGQLVVFACLVSVLGITIPLLFIAEMAGQEPTTRDYWLLAGAFLLFALVMIYVRALALRLALNFFHRVRTHVFEKALYCSRHIRRGVIVSRLTFNLGFVRQALENVFTVLGPGLALFIAGVPVTLILFPWTAPYMLVYLTIMGIYAWLCLRIQRDYVLQLHTSNSMLTMFLDDMVTSKTENNGFIHHPVYSQRFEKLSRRDTQIRFRRNLFYLVNQIGLDWIARVGHVVVLAFVLLQLDLNPLQKTVLVFLYMAVVIVPLMAMLRTIVQIAPGLICLGTLYHLLGGELGRSRKVVPVMVDRMEFLEAGADEKFSFSLERGSKVIVRDSGFFNYVTNGLAYGTARKRIRINGVPLDRVHVAAPSNVAVIGRSATINYGTLYQNIFLDEAEPVKTSVINQVFDQADRLRLTSLLTKPRGLSTLFEPSDLRLDFSDIVKLWLLRCMFSRFDFLLVDDIWDRMEKVDANLCQTYIADELSDRAQLLVFNAGVPRILTDYQLVAPARPPTLLRREAIG